MKFFICILIVCMVGSCGGAKKLLEKNTDDGGKIIIRKELFGGIDYLHIEKKIKGKVQYYIFYDCECGIENKIGLRKGVWEDAKRTLWVGVTDTAIMPKIYSEPIAADRLISPIEFMPITNEEKSLLEEGLRRVNKECCRNPSKPLKELIGYVRVKTN